MTSSDIDLLLAEKGNPCLSIIIPTMMYAKGKIESSLMIETALVKAKKLLSNSAWPKDKIKLVESKLDVVQANIGYIRLQEGLAIYLSSDILKIHLLPFVVKEKVMLGRTFEMRDLFYFVQYLKPYYLIAISRKRVRLLKGSGRDLQEISNHDFPKQYIEEYEYDHPGRGSSFSSGLKAFERDKSVVQEVRMREFFRQVDHTLEKYLKNDMLLFVAGVGEDIVSFEDVSSHARKVAGRIAGNYDIDAIHPLADSAWKRIQEDVRTIQHSIIKRLQENIGKQLAVDGIRNVWKAANEGKGRVLLVEKDYQVTGYIETNDGGHIFLSAPVNPYEIVLDAADDVIEIVKEKGGEIVVVENGELKDFDRIALLLRYD